jgi:DNA-binding transcriptional ArsR family regulator
MVNYRAEMLDDAFGALSDPTRRAMIERLSRGPASTGELAQPFALSLPAVMKHLRALESAGIVLGEKRGRVRRYRLEPAPLRMALTWLEANRAFWEARLDALEEYLEGEHR